MYNLIHKTYRLLRELQRNEKHKRNYVKVTVLLMLHLGKSVEKISICLGISEATVRNYEQKYASKGLDAYLEDDYVAYQGKLNDKEKAVLSEELTRKVYQNTAQIVHFSKKRFGKYVSRYRSLVASLSFCLQKDEVSAL